MPPYSDYDPAFDSRVDHIWPELALGKITLAPIRVGMNAKTGAIMVGWDHVVQSAQKIYATRFHERILRRWVGSFVPQLLGESITSRIITTFWWAVASALDLWEPCYHIARIGMWKRDAEGGGRAVPYELTSPEEIRAGAVTFLPEGVYMPRGHLGDATPEDKRNMELIVGETILYTRNAASP
jgi:phage baseplate assembly protein W